MAGIQDSWTNHKRERLLWNLMMICCMHGTDSLSAQAQRTRITTPQPTTDQSEASNDFHHHIRAANSLEVRPPPDDPNFHHTNVFSRQGRCIRNDLRNWLLGRRVFYSTDRDSICRLRSWRWCSPTTICLIGHIPDEPYVRYLNVTNITHPCRINPNILFAQGQSVYTHSAGHWQRRGSFHGYVISVIEEVSANRIALLRLSGEQEVWFSSLTSCEASRDQIPRTDALRAVP
jgi:hypothetical protein